MDVIKPDWPVASIVHSFVTTREGGISIAPYSSFNLGDHVGDDPETVGANRQLLRALLPANPIWLKQVHGTVVSTPAMRSLTSVNVLEADAAITNQANEVLVVMTADCLPIFFSHQDGGLVGLAHAGWRGLCNGVIENTVTELLQLMPQSSPAELSVWMGPAIGPEAFEVGEDVYAAFVDAGSTVPPGAFKPITGRPGKYFANLYVLAQARLSALGVKQICGGNFCTFTDRKRFFSHRRDGISGRFASLIWFTE
jgi:polyphenol oxidase